MKQAIKDLFIQIRPSDVHEHLCNLYLENRSAIERLKAYEEDIKQKNLFRYPDMSLLHCIRNQNFLTKCYINVN